MQLSTAGGRLKDLWIFGNWNLASEFSDMDLKPQASLPPSESRYEYQVVAVLQTGDNNLYITDSRDRALLVFSQMNQHLQQGRHYKQVYIQVGVMVFDQSNLGRLP